MACYCILTSHLQYVDLSVVIIRIQQLSGLCVLHCITK